MCTHPLYMVSTFNLFLQNLPIIFYIHGETFYINFYYFIFQFREKFITLRIFVSKNTKILKVIRFSLN